MGMELVAEQNRVKAKERADQIDAEKKEDGREEGEGKEKKRVVGGKKERGKGGGQDDYAGR